MVSLSSTTKNSIIKLIKTIMKFGYLNYDIPDNAKGLSPFVKPFNEQKEKRVMNFDEFDIFIQEIDNRYIEHSLNFVTSQVYVDLRLWPSKKKISI